MYEAEQHLPYNSEAVQVELNVIWLNMTKNLLKGDPPF